MNARSNVPRGTSLPAPYHCYSFDGAGRVLSLDFFTATDESSARAVAATALRQDPQCRIVELWEVGHQIARLSRDEVR